MTDASRRTQRLVGPALADGAARDQAAVVGEMAVLQIEDAERVTVVGRAHRSRRRVPQHLAGILEGGLGLDQRGRDLGHERLLVPVEFADLVADGVDAAEQLEPERATAVVAGALPHRQADDVLGVAMGAGDHGDDRGGGGLDVEHAVLLGVQKALMGPCRLALLPWTRRIYSTI